MLKKTYISTSCKSCNKEISCIQTQDEHYYCESCKKNKFTFTCNACGKSVECSFRIYKREHLCKRCKTIKTCKIKYNTEFASQSRQFREKVIETTRKKYGVDNISQAKSIKEKKIASSKARYGTEHTLQAKEVRESIEKTNLEKYGHKNNLWGKEVRQKIQEDVVRNYGVDHHSKIPSVKEKREKTNKERYGNIHAIASPEVRDKIKKTTLERYGCSNVAQVDDFKEKAKKTNLEKYGEESYILTSKFHKEKKGKYLFQEEYFDSSWELAFWVWNKDKGNKIERNLAKFEYEVANKKKFFFPDFNVEGVLYEIKGDFLYQEPYCNVSNAAIKEKLAKQNNIVVLKKEEMQVYLDYVKDTYGNSFFKEHKKDFVFLYRQALDRRDNFYLNFKESNKILKYHPSVWKCSSMGYKSPYDALFDEVLLKKAITNQLKYSPGDLSFEMTMRRFSVARIAKRVSLFNPALAKRLIEKYLGEYKTIFDPCSGFSGRLLGAIAAGKEYVGQDLNPVTVEETNSLILKEGLSYCSVVQKDLFEDTGTYESLFTCTPYELKETWGQSIKNLTCDEWIDEIVSRYTCKKYLFVVDKTEKYKDNIVETLEKKSHFGTRIEYVVLI